MSHDADALTAATGRGTMPVVIDAMFRLPRPVAATAAERYAANIEALRLLRSIDGRAATDAERLTLARYSGWGDTAVRKLGMTWDGIPIAELADLRLDQEERRGIAKSTMNAHFTSWEVIDAIWAIAIHLGLGDVVDPWILEPSCGVGHFFGVMPDLPTINPAHVFGIEIDPLTARIARALYPTCKIGLAPFERAPLPEGAFDLAIGNVPFGNYPVDDERLPQRLRRQIHDYFVCRSVDLLRPGGVAILITSKGTLDKDATDVRRWLADRADLIGAMRLPSTSFEENAGTSVTTDLLVLRRLERDAPGREVDWLKTAPIEYHDAHFNCARSAQVNLYYHAHPHMVLGEWCHNRLAFGREDGAGVKPRDGETRSIGAVMRDAALRLPAAQLRPRVPVGVVEVTEGAPAAAGTLPPPAPPLRTPAYAAAERLAGTLRRLLRAQVDGGDDAVAALRRRLNVEYDALRARYGALRAAETQPRHVLNPATREQWWALCSALEDDRGEKAAVFRDRTVARVDVTTTTDPLDALYLTLDELGRVDLPAIAERCGKSAQEVSDALRGAIYRDSPGGEWLTASQYLSGHVTQKLRQAREWAIVDPAFAENVQALETVIPSPVPIDEITFGLGAGWIPVSVYDAFLRFLFSRYDGHGVRLDYVEATATWIFSATSRQLRESIEVTSTYGTSYFDGIEIVQHALSLRVPIAIDYVDDGSGNERPVRNEKETILAQAKLADVRERWASWIKTDERRARDLAAIYNDKFNGFKRRDYDGRHLRFPGIAATLGNAPLVMRAHQVNGALRIVDRGDVDDTALLTYDVGWGKTLAIVAGVIKRLQLGLSRKACIVVPRHVLGQWADTIRHVFPAQAEWMLAATDNAFDDRRRFLTRAATSDARIVLLTYEQFRSIPLEPELFTAYMSREVVDLEEALADAQSGEETRHLERTLKRRQKSLEHFEVRQRERWRKATSGADAPVAWRSLGFDLLAFDEAHYLKNDAVNSRMDVAGMPRSESMRALDARVKAHWLIAPELFPGIAGPEREGKLVGATATPITNTLAEIWVMLRLFQPRLLRRLGFWHFDAWAATFTSQWQNIEMDSVGKFTTRTRLKFQNVPEILDALALCWDSAPDCADMSRPDIAGGEMEVVETEGSEDLMEFTESLAQRADAIRSGHVKPDEDNMLLITHEGRCASLFNGRPPAKGEAIAWPIDRRTKIDAVAEYVWKLYCRTDAHDGVILVFCDLYTPKTESASARVWNEDGSGDAPPIDLTPEERWLEHGIYGVIVDKCRARGVLADEIAYIHDAATDSERRALFARVNRGQVRVLIGSTQKLGTGVNVQRRAIAALQVTVPWRPDWLRQATGRVRRPGNMWAAVHDVAFPTTRSYDVVLWQMIQQKAELIAAISNGTYAQRTADDVGDMVLSASVAKAIALGDVRVLDKVRMEADLSLLQRAHRTWRSDRVRHEWEIRRLPDEILALERDAAELDDAIDCRNRHPLPGGTFLAKMRMVMSEDWGAVTDRSVADRRLQVITESLWHKGAARVGSTVLIGTYRGFTLTLEFEAGGASLTARPGDDGTEIEIAHREFPQAFAVLEHRLAELEAQAYRLRANARLKQQRLEDLQRAAPAWRDHDRARDLLARYTSLCADLAQGGIVDAQSYCFD